MIYGAEFHFLSTARVHLGISYLKGTLHEGDVDFDYTEISLGFFFFFVEITFRKRVN